VKPGLKYTSDRATLIRTAREHGLSDKDVLKALVANEYGDGDAARRKIIREWATDLGLAEEAALQTAREAGLIAR
jgi:hypothetical protein